MKIRRVSLFALLGLVVVGAGLLLLDRRPPTYPLTLTFVGYSSGSNGQTIASFCMSNHSSQPVVYLAESSPLPHYYYTSLQFHDAKTGWTGVTNYRGALSAPVTEASLPGGGSITFAVPMTAGTSAVKVGVCYLPHHVSFGSRMAGIIERSLSGQSSKSYDNLELKAPFK